MMEANRKKLGPTADIEIAFDVGHSSIGWAVLQARSASTADDPVDILGCGSVTFGADDCLASKRRLFRRQRRHARSTRQRIERLEKLLLHLGVLSKEQLSAKHTQAGGHPAPWLLAARVLASNGDPKYLLNWEQMWDVLRWYAHNRGYDGNRRWSALDAEEEQENTEKVEHAIALMTGHGTRTFAETVCAALKLDPFAKRQSTHLKFKNLNAAFPRDTVRDECRKLLEFHSGRLANLDATVVHTIIGDDHADDDAWKAVDVPGLVLPARYKGSLLFGQLVPRFENRIIARCPISGDKVPERNCVEFLRFRWAMLMANLRVAGSADRELRPLSKEERVNLDARMMEAGHLTPTALRKAVEEITRCTRHNLETMFLHPDSKEALLVDPVQKLVRSGALESLFSLLPERYQKRARGQWRRGKSVSLKQLLDSAKADGESMESLDQAVLEFVNTANKRKSKKAAPLTLEDVLNQSHSVRSDLARLSGRAAYSRAVMKQAVEEVLAGIHPTEKEGCLYRSEEIRRTQVKRAIDEQTNNHLVRHRLLILNRLFRDIVADENYAAGDLNRIARITIEVNRDLRAMSGKTAKEIKQDLGIRLKNFKDVQAYLEKSFAEQTFNGRPIAISAGLIRKARIAEDLGWQCPFTGKRFEPIDLVSRRVDKDHIIPRSLRPSDSLDSLVITFSEVNRMKGKRTAVEFIREFGGQPVDGMPELTVMPFEKFKKFVEGLDQRKGHDDDKKRKRRRKELLMIEKYEEKEFTPRDLTVTSQLVRLGAQGLQREFLELDHKPVITSMPGSVTGAVRKGWHLLGCLSDAAPGVVDETGMLLSKTDIREVTHLHHALDACVLGLASHLFPNNGQLWEIMLKRQPNERERPLLAATGFYQFDANGKPSMTELPQSITQQIRSRLCEKRVVQHIPADMSGLRVEENTRGVVEVKDGRVKLRQQTRDKDGRIQIKETEEVLGKLVGLSPMNGSGKLAPQKGVRVITDNYGLAILDHAENPEEKFVIIPWHKVWHRIQELKVKNNGKPPVILRKGDLIKYQDEGADRIVRVFGSGQRKRGIYLDAAEVDALTRQFELNPKSLLKKRMQVLSPTLVGATSTSRDAPLR